MPVSQIVVASAAFVQLHLRAGRAWREPFTELRVTRLFYLRRDPFERAQHQSNTYNDWFLDCAFVPMQQMARRLLMTMRRYPPPSRAGLTWRRFKR